MSDANQITSPGDLAGQGDAGYLAPSARDDAGGVGGSTNTGEDIQKWRSMDVNELKELAVKGSAVNKDMLTYCTPE